MSNTNCLEGFSCPKCGATDKFRIEANVWCDVTDNGAVPSGSIEWDGSNACQCSACGHLAPVSLFEGIEEYEEESIDEDPDPFTMRGKP